jgi:glycosyltransferase involved in cell wall biosynthesis
MKRVKRRHLKLGPTGILIVSKNHLKEIFGRRVSSTQNPLSAFTLTSNNVAAVDWLARKPSLTILLTVFNQSREQLEASINSARIQNGAEIEIVILDDGSTRDETVDFLDNFQSRDNESLRRQQNSGVIKARNYLINNVRTDFLVFLDPDDEFNSDYISSAFAILESDRSIEIVYPDVLIDDVTKKNYEVWYTGPFNLETLSLVNTIPMSSVISTRLMRSLDGYSKDFETGPEDWDLWVRAALSNAKAAHLPIIGYRYTKAQISRSSNLELTHNEDSTKIKLRKIGIGAKFPFNIKNEIDIFLVIPWLIRTGGVEKYVNCLAEDLTNAGFNVVIVTTEADPVGHEDDSPNVQNLNQVVLKRIDFPSENLFFDALKRLATPNCIAINFGSPWEFNNALKTKSIFAKRICFVFNTEISLQRAVDNQDNFDEFWLAYEGIKTLLPNEVKKRAHTIYTGVIDPQDKPDATSRNRSFTAGYFGRFSEEKNPELFLDIAAAASLTDLKFIMGGEGQLLSKIINRSNKLGNLTYAGYFSNANEFFSLVDCLIITSKIEGIPLSAMEALSHGIPVLSTDVGGMRELLVDQSQGIIWSGISKEALPHLIHLRDMNKIEKSEITLPSKFWRRSTSSVAIERLRDLKVEKTGLD